MILKSSNYRCRFLNHRNWLFLIEITFGSSDLSVSYVEYFVGFWENTFGGALFKKVATLNAVNSVIEDSVMDIFLKILPVFQKAPVFTIFESTFCLWKNLTLILWYIGLGFVKYLNYLTGLGLVLYYIGVREGGWRVL